MNPRFFGDSYDLVKRFFCHELAALGYDVVADPMFTGEWRMDIARIVTINSSTTLTHAQSTSSIPLDSITFIAASGFATIRRLCAPAAVLACCMAGSSGCTTTTVSFTSVNPGHEPAMKVWSGPGRGTVTNHGPGPVMLTIDAEGDSMDLQETIQPGTRAIRLRGWTDLIISNPPVTPGGGGAGGDSAETSGVAASFTLTLSDPCTFDGGVRAISAPTTTLPP